MEVQDVNVVLGKRANGKHDIRTIGVAFIHDKVISIELSSNTIPLITRQRVDEHNGTKTVTNVQQPASLKIFLTGKSSEVADDEEVSMEF